MLTEELAAGLLKFPGRHVLIKVGDDWCETRGVCLTGRHQNAVTLSAYEPALPGVIVVEPDVEPPKGV